MVAAIGAKIDFSAAGRSLWQALADGAAANPGAVLTVVSDVRPDRITLAELFARGERFGAHLVRLGIGPGDIVAVQLPAWSEWLVAAAGIARAGAVLLPVVAIYGAKELGFILAQSRARMIVTPASWRGTDYRAVLLGCGPLPDLAHHVVAGDDVPGSISFTDMTARITLPEPEQRTPDDLALLVYTSGTTSAPKGVRHTGRSFLSELVQQAHARDALGNRVLSPWPPGHVAGALGMLRFMVQGITLVLMDQWSPAQAASLVEEHRISAMSTTPFHLSGLLDGAQAGGHDLSSLKSVMTGAAPVPSGLIMRCEEAGLHPFRCYGSSEMPTVTTGYPSDPLDKRLTTEGRLLPGAEIRFVDEEGNDVEEGEIALRGAELFAGYTDPEINAASFLEGGWFLSGDVGRLDPEGYLLITDRKKDVIIRGGENISSREVEELLFDHPDIAEAAVVAAPDERMGEIVCAFLIPAPGRTPTLEAIRAHFTAAGIARQKTPERIELVGELPRNGTGKVLKHELRARVRNG